jgi:hypothetical protein
LIKRPEFALLVEQRRLGFIFHRHWFEDFAVGNRSSKLDVVQAAGWNLASAHELGAKEKIS